MEDSTHLPHLLRLLDDDSAVVRAEVGRSLAAFGADLDAALDALPNPPDADQRTRIEQLLREAQRDRLEARWTGVAHDDGREPWYMETDSLARLENGLGLLSAYQSGTNDGDALATRLDALAAGYRAYRAGDRAEPGTVASQRRSAPRPASETLDLGRYLFTVRGFTGDRAVGFHPRSSNLIHVIDSGRGLPISLACIYMLTGRRLGLKITGCNWPGHFLARVEISGVLVDGFNGGEVIEQESFLRKQGPSREVARSIVETPAPAEVILVRVLNNLVRAYEAIEEPQNQSLMARLREDLVRRAGLDQETGI